MTTLPGNELREDTPAVFKDEREEKQPSSLTNPRISKMAFDAVFSTQPETNEERIENSKK